MMNFNISTMKNVCVERTKFLFYFLSVIPIIIDYIYFILKSNYYLNKIGIELISFCCITKSPGNISLLNYFISAVVLMYFLLKMIVETTWNIIIRFSYSTDILVKAKKICILYECRI